MPSKTRLMLLTPQMHILKGKRVMAFFFKTIASQVDPNELPADWNQLSTRQRLMALAKYLPDGWVFTIVKEPAKNRPNRSITANIGPRNDVDEIAPRVPVAVAAGAFDVDAALNRLMRRPVPGGF